MAWLASHFFLLLAVSGRDTSWVIARGLSIFPPSFKSVAEKTEGLASGALGSGLSRSNPLRQAIVTYAHCAGIESGYGFFAPNIPDSFALVFEIHHPDGSVDYETPQTGRVAADLRLAGLLDKLGRAEFAPLREGLIKMMARATWREHPDAKMIRGIFGVLKSPGVYDYEQGRKESFEFWYAYDFKPGSTSADSDTP